MRSITFVKICLRLWLLQAGEQLHSDISILLGNKKSRKLIHKDFPKIYHKNLTKALRIYIDSKITDCRLNSGNSVERSGDLSNLPDLIDHNNNIDNE